MTPDQHQIFPSVRNPHDRFPPSETSVHAPPPDPALVTRLLHEGEVLGRLHHPNVAAVHDVVFVASEDGTSAPALVLDHVVGPTLAQFLEQA